MADNDSRAAMGAAPTTAPDMVPPPLPFYSTGAFRQAMLDGIDAVLLGQMDVETAVNRMAEEATLSLLE